jgi:hypothetical protein
MLLPLLILQVSVTPVPQIQLLLVSRRPLIEEAGGWVARFVAGQWEQARKE